MKNRDESRREFIKKSSLGIGAVALGSNSTLLASEDIENKKKQLPRQVWIATVSQQEVRANDF